MKSMDFNARVSPWLCRNKPPLPPQRLFSFISFLRLFGCVLLTSLDLRLCRFYRILLLPSSLREDNPIFSASCDAQAVRNKKSLSKWVVMCDSRDIQTLWVFVLCVLLLLVLGLVLKPWFLMVFMTWTQETLTASHKREKLSVMKF